MNRVELTNRSVQSPKDLTHYIWVDPLPNPIFKISQMESNDFPSPPQTTYPYKLNTAVFMYNNL